MTQGFDLSRYDDAGADGSDAVADPWANFVIIHAEDPRGGYKAKRANDLGKQWSIYPWMYPGEHGAVTVDRAQSARDAWGAGQPTCGDFWVDYEQSGVAPWQLAQARARRDEAGLRGGMYSYLYMLNQQDGLAAEWFAWDLRWIAYYPGNNDGSYPSWAIADAARWDALIWQFTSSNGTRDKEIVVHDEAKWAALIGGAAAPAEAPVIPKGKRMQLLVGTVYGGGRLAVLVEPGGTEIQRWLAAPADVNQFGIPNAVATEAPAGAQLVVFPDTAVKAWAATLELLEVRKNAPAAAAAATLDDKAVQSIVDKVVAKMPAGHPLDIGALAGELASHLKIEVTASA